MGAETTIYVEVEVVTKVWRKSYGVVQEDALRNVELNVGERLTGRTSYDDPTLTEVLLLANEGTMR